MKWLPFLLALLCSLGLRAQRLPQMADSIRQAFNIPELGFAVIKADTIPAIYLCGYHRSDRMDKADTARISATVTEAFLQSLGLSHYASQFDMKLTLVPANGTCKPANSLAKQ